MTKSIWAFTLGLLVAGVFGISDWSSPAWSAERQVFNGALDSYLLIQEELASDTITGLKDNALALARKSKELAASAQGAENEALLEAANAAKKVGVASNISDARKLFVSLSDAMVKWARIARPNGIEAMHCSMYNGSWLQKKGGVKNPYYGKKMLGCGEKI